MSTENEFGRRSGMDDRLVSRVQQLGAGDSPVKVLVFRIGLLGDTVLSVPALRAARRAFPGGRFTLLTEEHPGTALVGAAQLLRGSGLIDDEMSYCVPVAGTPRREILAAKLRLLLRLRASEFDLVLYLAPSARSRGARLRDRLFFLAAGIRRLVGFDGFPALHGKDPIRPLETTASEADLLLQRLRASGLVVPDPGKGSLNLGLGAADHAEVERWLSALASDGGRPWIAVGPGSNMPAKIWPEERFREAVRRLIDTFDIWPVVVGGPGESELGRRLVDAWGRGYVAAGALSPRGSAAAMGRALLYLGNDTGTMHLAAAASIPCVALFSGREWPGMWDPYGMGHVVLRRRTECEGCGLKVCHEKAMACLMAITVEDVVYAAECLLAKAVARAAQLVEQG